MSDEPESPAPIVSTSAERKPPPLRLIAGSLLGILAIVLVFQNREPVETKLLWATVEMPRAILLLTTFILGIIVGLLAAYIRRRQTKH